MGFITVHNCNSLSLISYRQIKCHLYRQAYDTHKHNTVRSLLPPIIAHHSFNLSSVLRRRKGIANANREGEKMCQMSMIVLFPFPTLLYHYHYQLQLPYDIHIIVLWCGACAIHSILVQHFFSRRYSFIIIFLVLSKTQNISFLFKVCNLNILNRILVKGVFIILASHNGVSSQPSSRLTITS